MNVIGGVRHNFWNIPGLSFVLTTYQFKVQFKVQSTILSFFYVRNELLPIIDNNYLPCIPAPTSTTSPSRQEQGFQHFGKKTDDGGPAGLDDGTQGRHHLDEKRVCGPLAVSGATGPSLSV